MKKWMVPLLFLPLAAPAEPLLTGPEGFVRTVQDLVKAERVIVRKEAGAKAWNVGLLIPAPEMFSGSSELAERGRQVLEKAGDFSRQSQGKMTVFVPDEREHQDFRQVCFSMHGGEVRRNAFIGDYVYIVIAKKAVANELRKSPEGIRRIAKT